MFPDFPTETSSELVEPWTVPACVPSGWVWPATVRETERAATSPHPLPTPCFLNASERSWVLRDLMAREFLGQRCNIWVQGGLRQHRISLWSRQVGGRFAVKTLCSGPFLSFQGSVRDEVLWPCEHSGREEHYKDMGGCAVLLEVQPAPGRAGWQR